MIINDRADYVFVITENHMNQHKNLVLEKEIKSIFFSPSGRLSYGLDFGSKKSQSYSEESIFNIFKTKKEALNAIGSDFLEHKETKENKIKTIKNNLNYIINLLDKTSFTNHKTSLATTENVFLNQEKSEVFSSGSFIYGFNLKAIIFYAKNNDFSENVINQLFFEGYVTNFSIHQFENKTNVIYNIQIEDNITIDDSLKNDHSFNIPLYERDDVDSECTSNHLAILAYQLKDKLKNITDEEIIDILY